MRTSAAASSRADSPANHRRPTRIAGSSVTPYPLNPLAVASSEARRLGSLAAARHSSGWMPAADAASARISGSSRSKPRRRRAGSPPARIDGWRRTRPRAMPRPKRPGSRSGSARARPAGGAAGLRATQRRPAACRGRAAGNALAETDHRSGSTRRRPALAPPARPRGRKTDTTGQRRKPGEDRVRDATYRPASHLSRSDHPFGRYKRPRSEKLSRTSAS